MGHKRPLKYDTFKHCAGYLSSQNRHVGLQCPLHKVSFLLVIYSQSLRPIFYPTPAIEILTSPHHRWGGSGSKSDYGHKWMTHATGCPKKMQRQHYGVVFKNEAILALICEIHVKYTCQVPDNSLVVFGIPKNPYFDSSHVYIASFLKILLHKC